MKVSIIGAGIAGLTMAVALKRANIPFVVYESAEEIKPVGAGIAMATNAMQVYRHLGLSDKLYEVGQRILKVQLTDLNLNVLTESDLSPFETQYQLANMAIHRSELHKVLVEAVGMEHIILNKRLEGIDSLESGDHQLIFTDGSCAIHTYIIGADGIRSKVRETKFGAYPLREAKQVCWRGVLDIDLPEAYDNLSLEGWGRAKRFGFVKLIDRQVYWYFLVNESIYEQTKDLTALTSDCHPMVQQLFAETKSDDIFLSKIQDLPLLDQWYKNKVALIGDAAHATTPNLGQGACQAIEDVYVISKLLVNYSLEESLERYTGIRRQKAHAIVKQSWMMGQVAQLNHPNLITIRNAIFRFIPGFLKNWQMKKIFDLQEV
ncbi:FAD-dependent monooxygenase [Myroides pelagicus]|uniref:NAD(P)-binding protein n=1 Tax=Myroides pelagicus TaxID=270914 RepID=A0A7K1GPT4_9FLAO|nr:FAD-dependent monooxygenase [Myroides pelagicus]MTH30877.1 NAD(P)-binding protein [Myroides pelagicus]